MSYDGIWVQCTENREHFHERSEAEMDDRLQEFTAQFDRMYAQGHFVVLSAGKDAEFNEIFLFENPSDAGAFYESDYKDWEPLIGDDDEGCGFRAVSLYWAGGLVVTKSIPPTMATEASNGQLG